MVRNWCNSKFKDRTTEELLDTYGLLSNENSLNFFLRIEIRDEVYARFSERMLQMGMQGFTVGLEERWQKYIKRSRKLVKRLHFGISAECEY